MCDDREGDGPRPAQAGDVPALPAGADGGVSQLAGARHEQGRALGRGGLLEALRRLASAAPTDGPRW